MITNKYGVTSILIIIIIVLSACAAAGGLFLPGLYRDNEAIQRTWFGNDIITLFIVVPMLAISLQYLLNGSRRAELICAGLLAYSIYNYAFYLFGAAFNWFFLLYVALFTLSVYALVILLSNISISSIQQGFSSKTPVKSISAFLIFIALPLLFVEGGQSLKFIFDGMPPQVPSLVFALDLSLVVPNMILSAVLLWKRKAWGFLLGTIMLIKGVTYGLVLITATASVAQFRLSGQWDPLLPFYIVVFAGSFICCMVLLSHLPAGSNLSASTTH